MYFYLIGIDYKTAPFSARANFYCSRAKFVDFWKAKEAALLFTCNRIEIYAVSSNADTAFSYITEFSRTFPDFFRYAYIKHGEKEVFRHALRLASGLESQLQGELQIFLQLNIWLKQESFSDSLKKLLEKALILTKYIRLQSGLDKGVDNIAKIVYDDLNKYFSPNKPLEIIVVGTGKIAELLARFHPLRVRLNFAANKNYLKAKELAKISGGEAFLLKDLLPKLLKADVLISATTSPHYVLKKEHFLKASLPFYIYDLALPPDIEPAVGGLPGIFLQNLDDLKGAIDQFNQRNQESIDFASRLVEETIEEHQGVAYAKNY